MNKRYKGNPKDRLLVAKDLRYARKSLRAHGKKWSGLIAARAVRRGAAQVAKGVRGGFRLGITSKEGGAALLRLRGHRAFPSTKPPSMWKSALGQSVLTRTAKQKRASVLNLRKARSSRRRKR
jgi:hypothetical protein